jgi:hypothetical protein
MTILDGPPTDATAAAHSEDAPAAVPRPSPARRRPSRTAAVAGRGVATDVTAGFAIRHLWVIASGLLGVGALLLGGGLTLALRGGRRTDHPRG